MKKTYHHLLAAACAVLTLAACDNVEPKDRATYVAPPPVSRAVLIQDFTGQRCVNCPKATEEIHSLQEEFGDTTVIAVAIHSGPFGKTVKGEPTPLYTSTGDEYFNYWGLESQPIGVIDYLYAVEYTDWGAGIRYELQQESPISLTVENTYDEATSSVSIDVQVIGLDASGVSGKVQVWLLEDSIIDYQLMPDGSTDEHYVHNHVFRTSVNDAWGDNLSVDYGEVKTVTYSQQLDAAWVPRQCSIVAFMYDENGVKQVTKKKIIN